MLTVLILIFIGTGFYAGYQRGLYLQVVYSVGYLISFIVAKQNYLALGQKIDLLIPYPAPTNDTKLVFFDKNLVFDMDKAFYPAVAFVLILIIGWGITKFIAMFFYRLTFIPIIKQGNDLAGGIVNAGVVVIGLAIFLTMISMVPVPFIQSMFQKSQLARVIVEHTPIISKQLTNWWINKTIM
ncbi:colicin V production protein CvpA [Vagococcus penaei]|uniref:Colicin V production protein CvpA n=1 Tax=Vagococcus penaei TaxID=633807 RepID=A0A1Q2D6Q4_9ENTE|nr:CvpA family protein [Vagococcus penaei]AQP54109.1 colicin V production protein CvpA [Vagococcus penaei]RSU02106.1 colicin V production protein CvpA [Vagococcus penaei]